MVVLKWREITKEGTAANMELMCKAIIKLMDENFEKVVKDGEADGYGVGDWDEAEEYNVELFTVFLEIRKAKAELLYGKSSLTPQEMKSLIEQFLDSMCGNTELVMED